MASNKNLNPDKNKSYGTTPNTGDLEVQRNRDVKYPKSVFFIISNEFCERFSYYGMRTILSIYLQNKLRYSETDSTLIYHSFVMLCYFFPVFGAILADSFIGKYKTILYLSIVYAFGSITMSATSTGLWVFDTLEYERKFALLGLLLVAMGTGGIKPCVSSFGGDQFVVPEQEKQLQQYFSVFYFSINAGSLISTFLTPELRSGSCLGQDTCYPLAFGVPAILMVTALVVFICGKWMYKIKKPSGNIMVDVVKCSTHAVVRKIKSSEKRDHWLDHARDKYSDQLVDDIKVVMSLILLFSPTILFWALFEQQGTAWTFQATRMNGQIGSFTIKPDQMQVINPVLILIFIPLFECLIYPILAKLRLIRTPLQKLTAGGLLVAIAFFVAAGIESKIKPTYEVLPKPGEAQLRIINSFNCSANFEFNYDGIHHINIDRLDIAQLTDLKATGKQSFNSSITINNTNCPSIKTDVQINSQIDLTEATSVSYMFGIQNNKYNLWKLGDKDVIQKNEDGYSNLRIAYNILSDGVLGLIFEDTKKNFTLKSADHATETILLPAHSYKLNFNGKQIGEVNIHFAGVYTLLINEDNGAVMYNLYTISPPNSIHILWQMPQIIILTAAEIMFSITGLEFSYSQAPKSMKSVMSSIWLLTDSLGNLLVVILAELLESDDPDSRIKMFVIYGSLMVIVMAVFAILARRYKYVTQRDDDYNGSENPAFTHEE